jgi:hypothetical protein
VAGPRCQSASPFDVLAVPATMPADSDLHRRRRALLIALSFDGSLFEYSFR